MNVQMRVHVLRTFIIHPLVHMPQKKIAPKTQQKIASVNGPLRTSCQYYCYSILSQLNNAVTTLLTTCLSLSISAGNTLFVFRCLQQHGS